MYAFINITNLKTKPVQFVDFLRLHNGEKNINIIHYLTKEEFLEISKYIQKDKIKLLCDDDYIASNLIGLIKCKFNPEEIVDIDVRLKYFMRAIGNIQSIKTHEMTNSLLQFCVKNKLPIENVRAGIVVDKNFLHKKVDHSFLNSNIGDDTIYPIIGRKKGEKKQWKDYALVSEISESKAAIIIGYVDQNYNRGTKVTFEEFLSYVNYSEFNYTDYFVRNYIDQQRIEFGGKIGKII